MVSLTILLRCLLHLCQYSIAVSVEVCWLTSWIRLWANIALNFAITLCLRWAWLALHLLKDLKLLIHVLNLTHIKLLACELNFWFRDLYLSWVCLWRFVCQLVKSCHQTLDDCHLIIWLQLTRILGEIISFYWRNFNRSCLIHNNLFVRHCLLLAWLINLGTIWCLQVIWVQLKSLVLRLYDHTLALYYARLTYLTYLKLWTLGLLKFVIVYDFVNYTFILQNISESRQLVLPWGWLLNINQLGFDAASSLAKMSYSVGLDFVKLILRETNRIIDLMHLHG